MSQKVTHTPSFSTLCSAADPASSTPTSYNRFNSASLCVFPNNRRTSQCLTVLSLLPLTRPCPSGVNATLRMPPLCPTRCAMSCPVWTSQRRTMLSEDPVATRSPSGEMETENTPSSIYIYASHNKHNTQHIPSRTPPINTMTCIRNVHGKKTDKSTHIHRHDRQCSGLHVPDAQSVV
jgi:hypothetical protein